MGHDSHFLSRLDRVSRDETDFALGLYRDHQAVHWILERARVPPDADRVAIALSHDENPPHLIVARDGGFVTCLARGMSIGSRPRIPRSELDRLVGESHEFHARWEALKNESSPKWFFRRLFAAGSHIAREDFLPFVQLAPALGSTFARLWVRQIMRLDEQMPAFLAEARKSRPDEDLLRSYWTTYHAAEHLMLLASFATTLFDAGPVLNEVGQSVLPSIFHGIGRFGMHSGIARAAWTAWRIGPVLRPDMFEMVSQGVRLSRVLTGYAVCAGLIASGATDLEAAAARALDDPPRTAAPMLERIRRQCLQTLATYRAGQAARRARAIDVIAAAVATAEGGLAASIRDGDPERLATAWVASDTRHGLHFGPAVIDASDVALAAPDLVLGARAEMLYAPRAQLDRMSIPWSRDEALNLSRLPNAEELRPQTVRRDGAVGRNDPCPCGSGKKYKKCCGG